MISATVSSARRRTAGRSGPRRPATPTRRPPPSARPGASTTSSIRGRCTCRRCSARRCARSDTPTKPSARSTFRTRWWRSRTPRRGNSATRRRAEGKPFVEVSGRKGLGVKIDDLLDLLIDEGRRGSRQAQSRDPSRRARPHGRTDCGGGDPLLHAEVLARQADRVRHRRSTQLRGRNGAVSAVCCRTREQHLPQTAGTRGAHGRRHRRTDRSDAGRRTRIAGLLGDGARSRRGSTTSSIRWCDRSSSRAWPSTRSASPRCSTLSTTATRFSVRSARS